MVDKGDTEQATKSGLMPRVQVATQAVFSVKPHPARAVSLRYTRATLHKLKPRSSQHGHPAGRPADLVIWAALCIVPAQLNSCRGENLPRSGRTGLDKKTPKIAYRPGPGLETGNTEDEVLESWKTGST